MEESRFPKLQPSRVRFELEEEVPTFRLSVWVPPKRLRPFRIYWLQQWDRLFLSYREKFGTDPILFHAHSFVGGAAAKYLSRRYHLPYVLTEHYSGFISGRLPAHWKKDLPGIYGNANRVIAVSRLLADAMGGYASCVEVIPNPIDTALFRPGSSRVISPFFHMVNVGSLIPRKGQHILLEALAQLPDRETVRLQIIGRGPSEHQLRAQVKALGLERQVSFAGAVMPEQLVAILQQAQLFVSVSHSESFGLVLTEALACGLPVISTPTGIAKEVIDEKIGQIVKNSDELITAIQRYREGSRLHHPELARQKVVSNYGRERVTVRIMAIYQEIFDQMQRT